jgi:spore coat polysaccharide biosynthesis protein SpsF
MTSTRLPGKILKTVLGRPLLEIEVERLRQIPKTPEIWIATTTNREDAPTVELAQKLKLPVFCGSEADVLGRYYECAVRAGASAVVRVTADCPLIDPDVISEMICLYAGKPGAYVQNVVDRTFPRGLDAEIFSFAALEEAHRNATEPSDREHVTPYIRRHFPAETLRSASGNYSNHRWTVDTREDFELVRRILEAVYPQNSRFRMKDVLQVLEDHPEWSEINADVVQKRE